MPDLETTNPIKPQLVLRVGVTGHRHASTIKIGDNEHHRYPRKQKERVVKQIKDTLISCREIIHGIHSEFHEFYSTSTPRLRFFSALAEGADQEAAKIALKLGEDANGNDEKNSSSLSYTLECIFPFPKEEYIKDFSESEEALAKFKKLLQDENIQSIFELEKPVDELHRPKAYEASGVLMLENIDILIAVWDGRPSTPGGTGDIVEKAQVRGIPIVWIRSDSDKPASFWCYDYRMDKECFQDISEIDIDSFNELESEVRRLIAPPDSKEVSNGEKTKAYKLLETLFKEKQPKKTRNKFYMLFRYRDKLYNKLYKLFYYCVTNEKKQPKKNK